MNRRDKAAFPWPLAAWWSYRRKRFWVLVVLALYTLAGFLLLPWMVKREVVSALQVQTGLPVSLAQIRINPWALTVEAEGLAINDRDDRVLVSFDRLFVNFQLASLVNRALTFREISVREPFGRLTRQTDGAVNLQTLFAAGNSAPAEEVTEEPGTPLRLIIHDLSISDGQLVVRDEALPTPFEAEVGPVDIAVQDLTTLPDRAGNQRVSIATPSGTRLEWDGSIGLFPLSSSGKVVVRGPYLPLLYQYVQDQLNFRLTRGDIEGAFGYDLLLDPVTGLDAELHDVDWVLRDAALEVVEADQNTVRFATLPAIELQGGAVSWPERTVNIDNLIISDPEIRLWRNEDGSLSVGSLLNTTPEPPVGEAPAEISASTPAATPAPTPAAAPAETPGGSWSVALDEFRIDGLAAELADRSLPETGVVGIRDLDFTLKNVSNQAGAAFPLSLSFALETGGSITAQGVLGALPQLSLEASIAVNGLALQAAQPWIASIINIDVESGTLNASTQMTVTPDDPLLVKGSLGIPALTINDLGREERLLGWENLQIDQLAFNLAANRLEISQIDLDAPYVRFHIAEDQSTNFGALAVQRSAEPLQGSAQPVVEAQSPPSSRLAVSVGRVNVSAGGANFSDMSLPLPFAADISELNGQLKTLSTVSREPAKISLKGRVDEYGLTEIKGQLLPGDPSASTDISVLFRNVDMPRLSPYTTKFAGRKIDAGRLELNLRYRIEDGRLAGENGIVIEKLKLGDKIDVPGAADLPLGLAVALLTGPDGTIDLDMPVTGNVEDPSFSIGGVILKTFASLITKAVAAPFNLLGRLVGLDAEKLDRVEFAPGSAELAPPEQEKLVKLVQALAMRPSLGLRLSGVSDARADGPALRQARVEAEVESRLSQLPEGSATMLSERRRRVLEALAGERLNADLSALREQNQRPADSAKPEGTQVLDEPAYLAALENLLVTAEAVGTEDLDQLAENRALAVRDALTAEDQVDVDRIGILPPGAAKLDGGWIPMRMKIQAMGN